MRKAALMEAIDAAKCCYKHHLGSEHTFKHTAEFLQSSTESSSAGAYSANNETQRINVWLLFLIAITDILDKEHVFRPLQNHLVYSQKLSHVD